jgi:beta-lactamase class C
MKRRQSLALLLSGLGANFCRVSFAEKHSDPMEAAAALIQSRITDGTLESATLYLCFGDQPFADVFGKARRPNALFLLGSITKTMTATGVMLLADRGELKISDPVMKFIPEFSEGARKEITIEHLLTHTSGLPDQLENNADLRARHAPLAEFVQGAILAPLLFTPGTRYHYQSMGILLAAEVAERITKKRFPDFLAAEVFEPLGMKSTVLGMGAFQMADAVRVQTEHAAPESGAGAASARDWDWNSPYWRNLAAPWGGAHSSAGDVAQFLRSFLHPDGKVLCEETARLMIQNHTAGLGGRRGLGFALEGFGKGCSPRTFGHSGSTGMLAWADPESDLTCVILTSLPAIVSRPIILEPVSDLVSAK